MLLLSSCTPYSRGYIAINGDEYRLETVPNCDVVFSQVVVKYLSEPDVAFEDQPTVWSVESKAESGLQSVALFGPVPEADASFTGDGIDLSREVVVWWVEGDGREGSVVGVLGDIKPGFVLWDGGYEDAGEFADAAPGRSFGC
jgi:hypothetical protein